MWIASQMKTIPNSSATLQYRSISQSRLRSKYCTTNQQHIERVNMLSDQRSKTSKKWKTPGFKSLSYFQIYFIHVLARLSDRPSLFFPFSSLHSISRMRSPLIVISCKHFLLFTLCMMEPCTKGDGFSQGSSQSTGPSGKQIVYPQRLLSRCLQSSLLSAHKSA